MLSEIISNLKPSHVHLLLESDIVLGLLAHLHDGVPLHEGIGVGVGDPPEVRLGDGVDDGLVLLHPLLAVQVQDRVVGLALPDAREAVVEPAHVDEAPRDAHAAPRVAQVGRVRREQEPPLAERRRAPLVHLVRRHRHHLVLVRLRVPREHQLELPRLALLQFLPGQTGGLAVGHPVHPVLGDSGRHLL